MCHDRRGDLETGYETEHVTIYAKHDVSMMLYRRKVGGALSLAEGRRHTREGRLQNLRETTNVQHREMEEMQNECERILRGFAKLDRMEEEENEMTMALDMQIKSVLAKVSTYH